MIDGKSKNIQKDFRKCNEDDFSSNNFDPVKLPFKIETVFCPDMDDLREEWRILNPYSNFT